MELRNLFPVAGALGAAFFLIADAGAAPSLPASLNGFVHYSTSNYGGKISDKYVQKTSIQALQSGKTLFLTARLSSELSTGIRTGSAAPCFATSSWKR